MTVPLAALQVLTSSLPPIWGEGRRYQEEEANRNTFEKNGTSAPGGKRGSGKFAKTNSISSVQISGLIHNETFYVGIKQMTVQI